MMLACLPASQPASQATSDDEDGLCLRHLSAESTGDTALSVAASPFFEKFNFT